MSKKSQPKTEVGPAQPKQLILTPQIAVCLQAEGPFVEQPNQSGSRKKVQLTEQNAYAVLLDILSQKAADIQLEREQRAEPKGRKYTQPDWRLIAKHPMAEIRQGLIDAHLTAKGSITVLPTRASELMSNKTEKSLEDMGL